MLNSQVSTELSDGKLTTAPLLLLNLMRDLAVLEKELRTVEDTIGQSVSMHQYPLAERLCCAGVDDQKAEDFIAWRRTISSLIADGSCDEYKLAKITAAEVAGVGVFADLIASIKNGEDHDHLPALAA